MTTTASPTLAATHARHLSSLDAARPATWAQAKVEALARFAAAPTPTRQDERWRFATIEPWSVEDFDLAPAPLADPSACLAESAMVPDPAGRLIFVNDRLVGWDRVDPALAARGVIFAPLESALQEHPELVRDLLAAEATRLGSEKYAALHTAFTRSGVVLHVPAGVELAAPFAVYHWNASPRAAIFPSTLVRAGANARVLLADVYRSAPGSGAGLAVARGRIEVGDGARVIHKVFQDWNEETRAFHLLGLVAQRDAFVRSLAVHLGGARVRTETQSVLEGPGSRAEAYSLAVAEGTQEIDQRTLQIHNAPHAASDLLFKNALLDEARTIFSGLIKVAENAQRTDAYQSNRNLLLSPTAEANSLPGLEIGANDVRCTHGSTTGQIDRDELFYLLARGIKPALARQLLVLGFFEEVLSRVESEPLHETLRNFIDRKFTRHGL